MRFAPVVSRQRSAAFADHILYGLDSPRFRASIARALRHRTDAASIERVARVVIGAGRYPVRWTPPGSEARCGFAGPTNSAELRAERA